MKMYKCWACGDKYIDECVRRVHIKFRSGNVEPVKYVEIAGKRMHLCSKCVSLFMLATHIAGKVEIDFDATAMSDHERGTNDRPMPLRLL